MILKRTSQIINTADSNSPFYLHICYNAPHFPLEAPDDLINKYRGRYLKGWDQLKSEKLDRMREMGIVSPEQEMAVGTGFSQKQIDGFDFKPSFNCETIAFHSYSVIVHVKYLIIKMIYLKQRHEN